jgi:hypothetical protein
MPEQKRALELEHGSVLEDAQQGDDEVELLLVGGRGARFTTAAECFFGLAHERDHLGHFGFRFGGVDATDEFFGLGLPGRWGDWWYLGAGGWSGA